MPEPHADHLQSWLSMLHATRLVAVLEPEIPWRPGPELAVTVRGAFGLAVREVACVQPGGDCAACREAPTCLVPGWFEGRGHDLRPFSLRVAWPVGELVGRERPIRATWTFFGPVPRPSLVVEALHRMARAGLGPLRVPHRVVHAAAEGLGASVALVQTTPSPIWPEPAPLAQVVSLPADVRGARVDLVTRLSFGKRLGGREPEPSDIVRLALARVRHLAQHQGVSLPVRWPDPREAEGRWLYQRRAAAQRWSGRQRQEVWLDGWLGCAEFGPEIAPFVDLLAFSEIAQIGRDTTAGLGVVQVGWAN
ncbi:MAG: CRISPR system precrRNA processing endoribonuclease RAMP protein Cas6 [Pseudomonadota bacterium]